jgi:hypothetical protein
MPNNQFQPPPQPYSLQEIALRILSDCDYAQFIHEQVLLARQGDADARSIVDANFQPQTSELNALHIPPENQGAFALCTCPKTNLIDFAGFIQTGH